MQCIFFVRCTGCSKSGIQRKFDHRVPKNKSSVVDNDLLNSEEINRIKMRKENGVYMVPIEINGIQMEFIFDTGSSDITISALEAIFLYRQGKLSDDDIIGTKEYQIADGTIAEGTTINLKTVKIGNKIIENVEASVIHNMQAPLLIGQSALSKFGEITIDYNRNEIQFIQ